MVESEVLEYTRRVGSAAKWLVDGNGVTLPAWMDSVADTGVDGVGPTRARKGTWRQNI
jgi:hypothetical protein